MPNKCGKIVYVVGPSGAGKDTLIEYARTHLPPGAKVRIARRSITRPKSAGGEDHIPLTHKEFDELVDSAKFAMHWRAHGNGYGIGAEIRDWLRDGNTVVVSGSREYLPQASREFSNLVVMAITVSGAVLRERLSKRKRESPAEIEERLVRAERFAIPGGIPTVEVRNDDSSQDAGSAFLREILKQTSQTSG